MQYITLSAIVLFANALAARAAESSVAADGTAAATATLLDDRLAQMHANVAAIGAAPAGSEAGDALLATISEWYDRELNATFNKMSDQESRTAFAKFATRTNFEIRPFAGFGRGIATRRAIAPGETFMAIPCGVAMTLDTAFASPLGPELVNMAAREPGVYFAQEVVMLHLAYEALTLERSFWRPYIELLPPVGPGIMPVSDMHRAASALRAAQVGDSGGLVTRTLAAYDAVLKLSNVMNTVRDMDKRRRAVVAAARAIVMPFFAREVLGVPVRAVPQMAAAPEGGGGGGGGGVTAWDGVLPRDGGAPVTGYLVEIDAEHGGARLLRRLTRVADAVATWAYDNVKSRAWSSRGCLPPALRAISRFQEDLAGGDGAGVQYSALIPLADMVNHDNAHGHAIKNWKDELPAEDDAAAAAAAGGSAGGTLPHGWDPEDPLVQRGRNHLGWAFVNGATHARAPGDQVFISYEDRDMTGVMCNNMLLSQYSFTLPREPARDCLHITVTRAAAEGGGSVGVIVKQGADGDDDLLPYQVLRDSRRSLVKPRNLDAACRAQLFEAVRRDAPLSLVTELKTLRVWRQFLLTQRDTIARRRAAFDAALAELDAAMAGVDRAAVARGAFDAAAQAADAADRPYDGFDLPFAAQLGLAGPDAPCAAGAVGVSDGEVRVVARALAAADRRWLHVLHAGMDDADGTDTWAAAKRDGRRDAASIEAEAAARFPFANIYSAARPVGSGALMLSHFLLDSAFDTRVTLDATSGACVVEDSHTLWSPADGVFRGPSARGDDLPALDPSVEEGRALL